MMQLGRIPKPLTLSNGMVCVSEVMEMETNGDKVQVSNVPAASRLILIRNPIRGNFIFIYSN